MQDAVDKEVIEKENLRKEMTIAHCVVTVSMGVCLLWPFSILAKVERVEIELPASIKMILTPGPTFEATGKIDRRPLPVDQTPLEKLAHYPGAPRIGYDSFLLDGRPEDFLVKLKNVKIEIDEGAFPPPYPQMPCRCQSGSESQNVVNWDLYEKYPPAPFRLSFLGLFRGRPVTKLVVFSGEYTLATGLQRFLEQEMVLTRVKGSGQFVINLERHAANKKGLLIVPAQLELGAEEFRAMKASEGLEFKLLRVGREESALEVKKKIFDSYQEEEFSYAIILGDEELLLPFYLKTSGSNDTPSDLPFFTFDGHEDQIPDVFYGRIPVANSAQLNLYLELMRDYEFKLSQSLGIASSEGSAPSDIEYAQQMQKFLKISGAESILLTQNSPLSHPDKINEFLQEGPRWLSYIGHGDGRQWPSVYGRPYAREDINKLHGSIARPIVIDVACQNGRFSRDNRLGVEFLLPSRPGAAGASAYYGGSVDISWDPPAIMSVGIHQALGSGKFQTLGEVLWAGQAYLLGHYDLDEAALENLVWYHLLGDPSLNIAWE